MRPFLLLVPFCRFMMKVAGPLFVEPRPKPIRFGGGRLERFVPGFCCFGCRNHAW